MDRGTEHGQSPLKRWREELLDLSARNPLLYFNRGKGTRIRITDPTIATLYESIVLREKSLSFPRPRGRSVDEAQLEPDAAASPTRKAGSDRLKEQPGDLSVDYTAGSARDVVSLQQKLRRLAINARTSLEERGVNTLFLALGLLEWREDEYARSTERAPLILVPVSLTRKKSDAYQLSCYEFDPRPNPVLDFYLRQTYGLTLPTFDEFSGMDGGTARLAKYFEAVSEAIQSLGWTIAHESWIAHFSFEKLVMYEDLGGPDVEAQFAAHPVLRAFTGAGDYEGTPIPTELAPPEAFEQPSLYPVLPADFSQLEVLAQVGAGNSLAVEGPPGTGKSQTIANLIAQALRAGKTVLFVSEKRAALEVVYRRLAECDLDRFCLELHSHRSQRSSVVSQLSSEVGSLRARGERIDHPGFEQLVGLRERLDRYVRELHLERGAAHLSAFAVHGELAGLTSVPEVDADLPASALEIDRAEEERMRESLRAIQAVGVWDGEDRHPWRGSAPSGPSALIGHAVERDLSRLVSAITSLRDIAADIGDRLGESIAPSRLEDVPRVLEILRLLADPPAGVAAVEESSSGSTPAPWVSWGDVFAVDPHRQMLVRYRYLYTRWWRRLGATYRRDRRAISEILGRRPRRNEAVALLTALATYREPLGMATEPGVPRPPHAPRSERGQVSAGEVLIWVGSLISERAVQLPPDLVRRLLEAPAPALAAARELHARLAELSEELRDCLASLESLFPEGFDGQPIDTLPLADIETRAATCLEHLDLLDEWRSFRNATEEAKALGLALFLDRARALCVSERDLEMALVKALRLRWLREVYAQSPELRDFDPLNHERLISRYRDLDRELTVAARKEVGAVMRRRREPIRVALNYLEVRGRPSSDRPDSDPFVRRLKDQVRLLRREASKKRAHLPIRRILPDVAELSLLLKPCFLMSPLSVATYLPRDRFHFDLVIFDEASQVLPQDAVGAILRGDQAVVFGDSRQLPPTPFFQRIIEEEEEELDDDSDTSRLVRGFESVLDLAKGALPTESLRWHYRSRDERLIAFSNQRFYLDSPLITFPSCDTTTKSTGVRLIVCASGRWERNLCRNLPEARLVCDLVVDHVQRRPDRSLGVIALGLGQAEAIDRELDQRLRPHRELKARLNSNAEEPFFVKNLENVQGDERDEIILSIGYGPEEPGGPVPLRFGPINQQGGERRLNVAVTRARYRTTVVASFHPEALPRAPELKPGPRYLHEYLVYAQRGGRPVDPPGPSAGEPESDFEEAVREALLARGYRVDPQVGASGYRIDLAVRDPDNPDRYILAIECDGKSYHGWPAARDRDRLRQEQLEALGWRFHRIWSTDWIRAPDHALDRVVKAIEQARKAD